MMYKTKVTVCVCTVCIACFVYYIQLQMYLPTKITQQYGHSAVVFGTGPDFRVVVLFGGKEGPQDCPLSETTLLLLCEECMLNACS